MLGKVFIHFMYADGITIFNECSSWNIHNALSPTSQKRTDQYESHMPPPCRRVLIIDDDAGRRTACLVCFPRLSTNGRLRCDACHTPTPSAPIPIMLHKKKHKWILPSHTNYNFNRSGESEECSGARSRQCTPKKADNCTSEMCSHYLPVLYFKRAQALNANSISDYGGGYMHFTGLGTYVDGQVAWLPALILSLNN